MYYEANGAKANRPPPSGTLIVPCGVVSLLLWTTPLE